MGHSSDLNKIFAMTRTYKNIRFFCRWCMPFYTKKLWLMQFTWKSSMVLHWLVWGVLTIVTLFGFVLSQLIRQICNILTIGTISWNKVASVGRSLCCWLQLLHAYKYTCRPICDFWMSSLPLWYHLCFANNNNKKEKLLWWPLTLLRLPNHRS